MVYHSPLSVFLRLFWGCQSCEKTTMLLKQHWIFRFLDYRNSSSPFPHVLFTMQEHPKITEQQPLTSDLLLHCTDDLDTEFSTVFKLQYSLRSSFLILFLKGLFTILFLCMEVRSTEWEIYFPEFQYMTLNTWSK